MIPSRSSPSPANAGFCNGDSLFGGGAGFVVDGAGVGVGRFGLACSARDACGACGGAAIGTGAGTGAGTVAGVGAGAGVVFGFGGASPVKPCSSACTEERGDELSVSAEALHKVQSL